MALEVADDLHSASFLLDRNFEVLRLESLGLVLVFLGEHLELLHDSLVPLKLVLQLLDVARVEALIRGGLDEFVGDLNVVGMDLLQEESVNLRDLLLI